MKLLIALIVLAGSVFAQTPTTIFGTPIVDAPRHVQAGYVGFNGGLGFGVGIAEQLTPGTYVITGMDFLPKGTIRKFSIATMPTGGLEQVLWQSASGKNTITAHFQAGAILPTSPGDLSGFSMATGVKYFRKIGGNNAIYFRPNFTRANGTYAVNVGVGFAHLVH